MAIAVICVHHFNCDLTVGRAEIRVNSEVSRRISMLSEILGQLSEDSPTQVVPRVGFASVFSLHEIVARCIPFFFASIPFRCDNGNFSIRIDEHRICTVRVVFMVDLNGRFGGCENSCSLRSQPISYPAGTAGRCRRTSISNCVGRTGNRSRISYSNSKCGAQACCITVAASSHPGTRPGRCQVKRAGLPTD